MDGATIPACWSSFAPAEKRPASSCGSGKASEPSLIRCIRRGAGCKPTRAAYNGVASMLGTAKVSSRTNLSRNLRATCLDHDPVAVEPGREEPSFALLIGLVHREWRFDQLCLTFLAGEAR